MTKDTDLTSAGSREEYEPIDLSSPEARKAQELRLLKSQPNSLRQHMLNLPDYADVPEEAVEELVAGVAPMETLGAFIAPGGSGKTTIAMHMGACLSLGRPWFGHATKKSRVLCLLTEDPKKIVLWRSRRIAASMGLTLRDLPDFIPLHVDEADTTLMRFDPFKMGEYEETQAFEELRGLCAETGANVLILDALHNFFDGNENARFHAAMFTKKLRKLGKEIGGGVILIAHPSRASEDKANPLSGSTSWFAGIRWGVQVERKDPNNKLTRNISFAKHQYGAEAEPFEVTYRDGVYVADDAPTGIFKGLKQDKAERVMLEGLRKAIKAALEPSPYQSAREKYAPKVVLARGGEGLKEFELAKAMNRLIDGGELVILTVGPPSRQKHVIVPKEMASRFGAFEGGSKPQKGTPE